MRWPSLITAWMRSDDRRREVPRGVQGTEPGSASSWFEKTDQEVNPELAGAARYQALNLMAMSDPVVAGSLAGVELPILADEAHIEPAGGGKDPVDVAVADALAQQLGLEGYEDPWMDGGFVDLIELLLLSLQYGSMTGELEWEDALRDWVPPGDTTPVGLYSIGRVGPRYPASIAEYKPGPGGGQPLASIRQGPGKTIDGARLIHVVNGRRYARFVGSSILRPAYGAWKLKRETMLAAAIGYDRHASGTPTMRHPANPEAQQEAKAIVAAHRSHEQQGVTLPGPKPTPENPNGWDFEIISGAQSLANPIPLLRHYDEQIVSATLQRFQMLGSTDTGSRAVGEVLAEPFYLSLNRYAARLARAVGEQLVRRWVTANFGPLVAVPKLTFGAIQQKNLEAVGRFMYEAASAGVDFTDLHAQNHVRAMIDLAPHLADYRPVDRREGSSPPL